MDMKTLRLLLFLLLMPFMAHAASPSFSSFIPTQFTNNNIVIGLNTNYVLTWQMVSTNSFTTNGNSLAINTNTFPTLAVMLNLLSNATNGMATSYNPNQFALTSGQLSLTNTVKMTNANVRLGMVVDVTGNTASPQFIITNSSGSFHGFYIDSTSVSYTGLSDRMGGYFTVSGTNESAISMWSRSLPADIKFMRWVNRAPGVTILERLNDAFAIVGLPIQITNNAPSGTLIAGSDGIVRFKATGGGIEFPDSTRQFTSATNAVRIFGLDGITASPSNNMANGSIDYRISSTGDTNFPHVVVTNGVLYGTSLWAASSDSTNYVLTLSSNAERTINMTGNVRVVGVSALAPAGFRGFVGVTVTNNSGSTFTVETTNTFRPYGTNSFSVPSGKDARIVFQIDENRVFYGGTVTP